MIKQLQKITTNNNGDTNGWIVPVFDNMDHFFDGYSIKFIYISSIRPQMSKGPKLHNFRSSMIVPICGKVDLVIRTNNRYDVKHVNADTPSVFFIPKGIPFCLFNPYNVEAIILNMADHRWDPNDELQVTDWDYCHEV